jgi:4-nitrophenyl phosphatase
MNAIPTIRSFAKTIDAALYQHAENRWAAPPHPAECASPCEGIVLDWDRCLANNGKPKAAVIRFLQTVASSVSLVSNNSTLFPHEIAAVLAAEGVRLPTHRIILAGTHSLHDALAMDVGDVLVVGSNRMKSYARSIGLQLVRKDADLVILLSDVRITYTKLNTALDSLLEGARLVAASAETLHSTRYGNRVLDIGAFLSTLQACMAPEDWNPRIIGKPEMTLYEAAAQSLELPLDRCVLIGSAVDKSVNAAKCTARVPALARPQGNGASALVPRV